MPKPNSHRPRVCVVPLPGVTPEEATFAMLVAQGDDPVAACIRAGLQNFQYHPEVWVGRILERREIARAVADIKDAIEIAPRDPDVLLDHAARAILRALTGRDIDCAAKAFDLYKCLLAHQGERADDEAAAESDDEVAAA